MNKWFYILMGIFGPVPALILGFWVSNWTMQPNMKEVILSCYILVASLLICVRILGGPKRSIKID